MKNWFEKIRLWWKFEGQYYHKDLQYGIQNLIRWFSIIWKQRDWDSAYMYDMMIHKLELQAKHTAKYGHHENSDTDAEKMFMTARLMKKVRDEFYQLEYADYHKTKFEFLDVAEEDMPEEFKGQKLYELDTTELSETFSIYFTKYRRMYEKVMSMDYEELIFKDIFQDGRLQKNVVAMNIAHMNHARAKKLLFKILESEMPGWWS
jgi:hypothetical protein